MATTVEAPLTFFQEPMKTVFRDAIKTPQMALRLIPKILDAVNVISLVTDKHLAVIHSPMVKFGYIQHVIDPRKLSIYTTLSGNTFSRMIGINVETLASSMMAVYTLPPRFNPDSAVDVN